MGDNPKIITLDGGDVVVTISMPENAELKKCRVVVEDTSRECKTQWIVTEGK